METNIVLTCNECHERLWYDDVETHQDVIQFLLPHTWHGSVLVTREKRR